jgi:hypothetical protein
MMGLPVTGERLIRPIDEPIDSPVKYDWHDCLADALVRRVELREQMWRVKQRELELIVAKNFLLPRLDAVASYRVDGFGDDLASGGGPYETLSREIFSFDNTQAQLGLQLAMPLGFRRELAGVRHSKLNLCRARAVLQDQEHLVSHNLGESFVSVETAYESIKLNHERLVAAEEVVAARMALLDAGKVSINLLLESQRRLADAQINYFQARVDHALAIRNLHFEKGTLLPFNGVRLQEGPWPSQACEQAWYERRRWMAQTHGQPSTVPYPVSLGSFSTHIEGSDANADTVVDDGQLVVEPTMELLPAPSDSQAADDDLGLLPTPELSQPRPAETIDPFIDEPGPGTIDPERPGPAELNSPEWTSAHTVSPGRNTEPAPPASGVAAASYLEELLDEAAHGATTKIP